MYSGLQFNALYGKPHIRDNFQTVFFIRCSFDEVKCKNGQNFLRKFQKDVHDKKEDPFPFHHEMSSNMMVE